MITKTKDEIEKLKRSSKLADDCFKFICKKIQIGMTEKQVAKMMDNYMLSNGATALAFETIVGSGKKSSQIHSKPGTRKIQDKDIIQLDFGCVVDGYCSDTSRVLFINEVLPEYKKIYNIVLKAQEKGIKETRLGMKASEIDAISRDYIKKFGFDFKHAVGHGVGKEVHEVPVISPKNTKDKIKNNVVFTIEPGIYIKYRFGIRIEDTVIMEKGKVIPLNHTSKKITIIKC